MVLSNEKKKEYVKRLVMSRMRLLINNGFYGLLLMHMIYSIYENCETAATDGHRIFFGPKFLDELSDSELDFIMMHEILHVVLQHCIDEVTKDLLAVTDELSDAQLALDLINHSATFEVEL